MGKWIWKWVRTNLSWKCELGCPSILWVTKVARFLLPSHLGLNYVGTVAWPCSSLHQDILAAVEDWVGRRQYGGR